MPEDWVDAVRGAAPHAPLLLCALTVAISGVGSLLPTSPAEPMLAALALVAPPALLVPLVLLATASHMLAKTAVYLAGDRVERLLPARQRAAVSRMATRLDGRRTARRLTLLASATTGLPPFYAMTVSYGALGLPLGEYLVAGAVGRGLRFAAVFLLPPLVARA